MMTRIYRVFFTLLVALSMSFLLVSAADEVMAKNLATEEAENLEVAVITGRVTSDWAGEPLAAVAIRLIDADSPNDQLVAAYTDFAGLYTATVPISNSWKIMFEPGNNLSFPHISEYYNDVHRLEEAEIITAEVGTVTPNINASLAINAQITGRVTAEENGQPLANVGVSVYNLGDNIEDTTGTTDSSGRYTVTTYIGGNYKLRFTPPDNSEYALEYYNDKSSLSEANIVTVAEGSEVRGVDIALTQGSKITGRVTSSWKGEFVAYPEVRALNEDGELIRVGGRVGDDPPGSYVVANLPAGTYQLQFVAHRHNPANYSSPITLATGETISEINAQIPVAFYVASIVTSPAIPNTIVLAFMHDPAPIVTLDGGRHWEILPSSSWVTDESIFSYPDLDTYHRMATGIALRGQPGEGTRFLVAVGIPPNYPGIRSGIYRSGDYGASWEDFDVDADISDPNCILPQRAAYTVSPIQPSHLYFVIEDCADQYRIKLLVSHNGGVTWQDVLKHDPKLAIGGSAKVVPSPLIKDRVYLSASGVGWYQSNDGGIVWESIDFPVESLTLDSQNEKLLYGWSFRKGSPWGRTGRRSWDGGATWEDWPAAPCDYAYRDEPPTLLADPIVSGVLFMRCDNDKSDGIYRSDDNGSHWKKLAIEAGQLLAIDYSTPGRLLWAKDDGLYASTDQGESWQVLLQGYKVLSTALYLPNVATDAP